MNLSFFDYVYIALGGMLGTISRTVIYQYTNNNQGLATWIVNMLGSFIVGLICGLIYFTKTNINESLRVFIVLGLLGSFTTFSAICADSIQLFITGKIIQGTLFALLQMLCGLLLAVFGMYLINKIII